jgi:signal transduction histidine kinase
VFASDINERKQAEEEIRKSKKLLEDLHKHLNEMIENERASISREIHDQIGQSLTALKLDLNRMHKDISTNPEAVAKLESMVELVSNTIKDVQRISSDLRPGILDELGLVSAIEWYCDEFEERTGIKCNLKLDDSDYSDSQINLTFFRVLQETLTNVIRHAKASSVSIKLHQLVKGVTMTIQDNGIGIPEEKLKSIKSLGLISMRERVKQFNGTIDISSKKDNGTKLVIFIPS